MMKENEPPNFKRTANKLCIVKFRTAALPFPFISANQKGCVSRPLKKSFSYIVVDRILDTNCRICGQSFRRDVKTKGCGHDETSDEVFSSCFIP